MAPAVPRATYRIQLAKDFGFATTACMLLNQELIEFIRVGGGTRALAGNLPRGF